jgi:hypothetical protein
MIYFQTKNPDLGKFWRALKWKMEYFMAIGKLVTIWYIFPSFGILYQEKNLATLCSSTFSNNY